MTSGASYKRVMSAARSPFRVVEALSHRGGAVNEDSFGIAGRYAWVVDGATGIGTRRFCPGASDAAWYAGELSCALAAGAAAEPGIAPAALLAKAIETVAEELRALAGDWPERVDEPHGAVVLLRCDPAGVDYAILGDSGLLAVEDGETRVVADPEVEAIDPAFARRIAELRAQGVTDRTAIQSDVKERIREIYATMNTPAGVAIAALDPAAVERAITGRLSWPDDGRLLLATDGLLRLIDPFEALDAEGLRQAAFEKGLGGLVDHLRRLETADAEALGFPRLKCHDDATALALLRD